MMRSARLAATAAPDTQPQDAPVHHSHGGGNSAVQLAARTNADSRMHDTLRAAMQLVSRLCDRGISERERTDCALRARGSLRLLEQMLGELPGALAAAPVRRQHAFNLREDR